jgi:ADP-ribose pyrophosphatase YjhB (NUDIX family)
MKINSTLTDSLGHVCDVVYCDVDSEEELVGKDVSGVHGYCFYGDKMVIVYSEKKGTWTPPGGGVEPGESPSEAVVREIKEESNMRVIRQQIIGYQDISRPEGLKTQTRSVCIVEPYGPFVGDPDGDIDKIELIDPKDYKKYFDWGEVGDHIMQRALEMRKGMG